jgi:tRNA-modifying protein YgfZ
VNVKARVTPWGTLKATGPDARSWLNGLLTSNIEGVTNENGSWSLLLNKRGKIIGDITLLGASGGLWLGSPVSAQQLHELLNDYLVMEDVECDLVEGFRWITLHGPGAPEVAQRTHAFAEAAGEVLWGSGTAAAVVVADAKAHAYLAELQQTDAVTFLDDAAWASWRVEHGIPEFGVDFGPDDNPHQASLERRTVDWSKGCYLGQEVVCMQDMRGKTKRRLVRLVGAADQPWQVAMPVSDPAGLEVGSITTARSSLSEGTASAIAKIKAPHFEPGGEVRVGGAPARVEALLPRG